MSGISFPAYLAAFSALIPATLCITYLFEGEACKLRDGSDGICGKFSDCGSAFSIPRNPPVLCSPRGLDDIICCPPGYIEKPKQDEQINDTETCSLLVDRDPKQTEESLSERACRMYTDTFIRKSVKQGILGGRKVIDMRHHAYMAALATEKTVMRNGINQTELTYICGGTLISDRFVLTAAHCDRGSLRVRMGALNLLENSNNSKMFEVEKFIAHPCYDMQLSYYDIALVKLTKAIQVTNYIFPACIFKRPQPEFNKEYGVSGWGATTQTGYRTSTTLLEASLTVEDPHSCSSKWQHNNQSSLPRGFAANTMFCALNHNSDACRGDSGGPLSLKNNNDIHFTVMGVISGGGSGCGDSEKPGLFTNIYPFLLWIEDVIWPDGNILPLQWDESVEYNNDDVDTDDCEEGSGLC